MITNNDILRISEPVEQMYMDCTSQLIINMCNHFKSDKSMTTAQWEIQKLSELDALTQESVKIIAANTGQSEEVITQAIKEATGIELQDAEKVLSGAAKAGTIQTASSTLATSPAVANVVKTLTEQAVNDTNIVNTVMLNSTRQRYAWAVSEVSQEATLIEQTLNAKNAAELEVQLAKTQRALNTATMSVATGAEARTTALRRVIGQLAAEGITGYIDIAGHQWSPEAYINMDIRTTVHNAAVQAQKDRASEYGVSTFQISSHLGARPLCAPYQGKFYSWDNTSGVLEDLNGKKYPYQGINTTSYGQPAGIFGINCGHNPQTFVNGYSLARYSPTEDAEENERLYKLTQQQRARERQIRQYKTEAAGYKAAGDDVAYAASMKKARAKAADYRTFCKDNGLTVRNDRLMIGGYDAKASATYQLSDKLKTSKISNQSAVDYTERRASRLAGYKARQQMVDVDAMSRSELIAFAKENLQTQIDFKGATDSAARGAVKAVMRFEQEGGRLGKTQIVFSGTGGMYGSYDPTKDILHLRPNDAFVERLVKENERAMLRLGRPQHIDPTYEGIAAHEIGHAFDASFGNGISKELSANAELLKKARSISNYGASSPAYGAPKASEAVAENMAAFLAGGEKRTQIDPAVRTILEGYLHR